MTKLIASKDSVLKFKMLWLLVGYGLIAYIIYSSLTPDPITMDVSYFDKYAHTFGYFVLMGWFTQIYQTARVRLICFALFVSMGIGLEFAQDLTGYRYFDVYDMLANSLGVVLAWLLAFTPFSKLLHWVDWRLAKFAKG